MEKSLKDGKTPEGEDEATIKGHEAEIDNLKLNLKRLEDIQNLNQIGQTIQLLLRDKILLKQ